MTTPARSQNLAAATAPDADQLDTARRTAAQHRRRRYPDTSVCGWCSHRWQARTSPTGKPTEGCRTRLDALDALDAAGQLDDNGRPTPAGTDQ